MFAERDSGHCPQLVPSHLLVAVVAVERPLFPVLKLFVCVVLRSSHFESPRCLFSVSGIVPRQKNFKYYSRKLEINGGTPASCRLN